MDLIVGHDNTDFDALAAAVAAQRLHPGAIIGFGRVLTGPVRDFWSLHKDRFPAERVDALPLDEVVLRAQTLIRRAAGHARPVIAAGPLQLDSQLGVITRDGIALKLTAFETEKLSNNHD